MTEQNRDRLAGQLVDELQRCPGTRVRELARSLAADRRLLNGVLYGRPEMFEAVGPQPPAWFLRPGASPSVSVSAHSPAIGLYAWQDEALEAWHRNGDVGIVEAVTGAGKTRLAIAAIGVQLAKNGQAAVIVPTKELLYQWVAALEEHLPNATVALMGDGHGGSLADGDVLVAVGASARRWQLGLAAGVDGLLVADECHRYGARVSSLALEDEFVRRLGLSATYERPDGAHDTVLLPYFDRVVFTLDYARAIADGVVASFRVALVGVEFSRAERAEYDRLSEDVRAARSKLVLEFGVTEETFADFLIEVNDLARHGTMRQGMAANRYLKAWSARRALLAETEAKTAVLPSLIPAFRAADRSIVFTRTTGSADGLAIRLTQLGVAAAAHHSKVEPKERKRILEMFTAGRLDAVTTAQTLNEGVDVPEADLAVVIAASQQRREMIQRMGRVLRRKADGRAARFVIIYVRGTNEDPAQGAYEAFLDDALDAAADLEYFDTHANSAEIAAFLAPHP